MNLLKNKIFYLVTLIGALIIIILVLMNTILYNYKGKLETNLNNYYTSNDETAIDNINALCLRYKNNNKRLNNINSLVNSNINKWINKYNDSYDSIDALEEATDHLNNKVSYLLDNLEDNLEVTNDKDDFLQEIKDLNISKNYYLVGLSYYNSDNLNDAYSNFKNVIDSDSYYDDTTDKIDNCIATTLDKINTEFDKLNTITDESTLEEKLAVYKNIYNYLIKYKTESKLELSKSKSFTDLLNEDETNLTNTYVAVAKNLGSSSNYISAIELLDEGIKLLTSGDVNVVSLTDLREAYALMLPTSLNDLTKYSQTGTWIKKELAIIDNNNNTYGQALTFYKGLKKSYNKNQITYNTNKAYKNLTFTLAMGKKIGVKSKDTGTIKVIGDNKVLATYELNGKITKQTETIDLNNINNLTIEYTLNYKGDTEETEPIIFAIMGNPVLSKY
jgi:hypothetical protein